MGKQASILYPSNRLASRTAWTIAILVGACIGASGEICAETIVLKNGEAIKGTVVDATRNTVIIKREIGGMRQMPLRDIESVQIELAQGNEINGEILSWGNGVYHIRSGDEVLRIGDGTIISRAAVETVTEMLAERSPSLPANAKPVIETVAPAAQEDELHQAPVPADMAMATTGASGRDSEPSAVEEAVIEQTVASEKAAASPDGRSVAVKASVKRATPGPGIIFDIELSRPAEQALVLIYGTLDGTAKAGIDYERQEGVLLLTPGTKSAEVRVPLIKRPQSNGDLEFELFLAADPMVVEVIDQKITATIEHNNQLR